MVLLISESTVLNLIAILTISYKPLPISDYNQKKLSLFNPYFSMKRRLHKRIGHQAIPMFKFSPKGGKRKRKWLVLPPPPSPFWHLLTRIHSISIHVDAFVLCCFNTELEYVSVYYTFASCHLQKITTTNDNNKIVKIIISSL